MRLNFQGSFLKELEKDFGGRLYLWQLLGTIIHTIIIIIINS